MREQERVNESIELCLWWKSIVLYL